MIKTLKVKRGAQRILQSAIKRKIQPLFNYILIPFHDPDVGPVTRTRNPKEFERELHNIRINGGGDCPEMSVYAIREALLLALGMISAFLSVPVAESALKSKPGACSENKGLK